MVICICNNINDKTIKQLASEDNTVNCIASKTGATTCCGCCKEMVRLIIEEEQGKELNEGVIKGT